MIHLWISGKNLKNNKNIISKENEGSKNVDGN
jgi:hypothetical protein